MSGAPAYSCPPGVCAGPAAGRGPDVVVLCDDRRGPGATVLAHAPRPAPGRPADTGSAATQPGRRVACAVSAGGQGAGAGARLPRCGALLGDRVTAVHEEVSPGDVGRARGGQPGNGGGALVG